MNTTVAGQGARYSFKGTAGQIVSTEVAGFGGNVFTVAILNPNGSTLGSASGSSAVSVLGKTLPVSGTYEIAITPNTNATGSATVSLISQTTNGAISFNTPVTTAISPSSLIGLNFSGTAGQIVSVEAAGLSGGFSLLPVKPRIFPLNVTEVVEEVEINVLPSEFSRYAEKRPCASPTRCGSTLSPRTAQPISR